MLQLIVAFHFNRRQTLPPEKSALTVASGAELWSCSGRVRDLPITQFPIKETNILQSGMVQCSHSCSRGPILKAQKAQHHTGLPWMSQHLLGMAALRPFLPRYPTNPDLLSFPPYNFPDSICSPPIVCCMGSKKGKR